MGANLPKILRVSRKGLMSGAKMIVRGLQNTASRRYDEAVIDEQVVDMEIEEIEQIVETRRLDEMYCERSWRRKHKDNSLGEFYEDDDYDDFVAQRVWCDSFEETIDYKRADEAENETWINWV